MLNFLISFIESIIDFSILIFTKDEEKKKVIEEKIDGEYKLAIVGLIIFAAVAIVLFFKGELF